MEKVVLENDDISIEILPSCGGKIRSLTSRASGRQWLWHNPFLGLRRPRYGDSYVATLDNGGWDEIFPSVAPCRVRLSEGSEWIVPDHGDIVALPAMIRRPDPQSLITTTRGRCADFEFEREIRLDGNRVELNYSATNTGSDPFPFLWCAHPLFRFEAGMEIDLEGTVPFRVESAFGRIPFRAGDSFWWSGFKGSDTIPNPADRDFAPFAMKFFSVADYVKNDCDRVAGRPGTVDLFPNASGHPPCGHLDELRRLVRNRKHHPISLQSGD